MNDEDLMAEAERELRERFVEILHPAAEGPQLGGAIVANVENFGLCEDGATLQVMLELRDGEMACYTFAPGEPIFAHIVGRCVDL